MTDDVWADMADMTSQAWAGGTLLFWPRDEVQLGAAIVRTILETEKDEQPQ